MTAIPILPAKALSVRQPWAYCLVQGWKPVENRDWTRRNPGLSFRGPFAIHASCGMTRFEYEDTREFVEKLGYVLPPAAELLRGGIVGVATITDIVTQSDSPWFFGSIGLVIADAKPIPFIPAVGSLGFFDWKEADASFVPAPAKWMLPSVETPTTRKPQASGLFG